MQVSTKAIFNQLDKTNDGVLAADEVRVRAKDGTVARANADLVGLTQDGFDGAIKKRVPLARLQSLEAQLEARPRQATDTPGGRVTHFALGMLFAILQLALLPATLALMVVAGPAGALVGGEFGRAIALTPLVFGLMSGNAFHTAFSAEHPRPGQEADELARAAIA